MTREKWRSKYRVRMCGASGIGCSEPRLFLYGVGGETWWGADPQLNTSQEDVRRRKFWSPIVGGGVIQRWRLRRHQADNHVRTRKEFKVCVCSLFLTRIYCLSLSRWRGRLSFNTPGSYLQDELINKILGSYPEFLTFVHFHHGEFTMGSKFSLVTQ